MTRKKQNKLNIKDILLNHTYSSSDSDLQTSIQSTNIKRSKSKSESISSDDLTQFPVEELVKKRGRVKQNLEVNNLSNSSSTNKSTIPRNGIKAKRVRSNSIQSDHSAVEESLGPVDDLIKGICSSVERLIVNNLTVNEAFIVLTNYFNKFFDSHFNSNYSTNIADVKEKEENLVDEKLVNEVINKLYEKLILIIIYVCKLNRSGGKPAQNSQGSGLENESDEEMIKKTAILVYKLVVYINDKFLSLYLNYIWNILLLLIYSKDKRLRKNFCNFLQVFVFNCCLDEIIINKTLYFKHMQYVFHLLSSNHSDLQTMPNTPGLRKRGPKGNKNNNDIHILLIKLLQSFQSDEVVNYYVNLIQKGVKNELLYNIIETIGVNSVETLDFIIQKLTTSDSGLRISIYKKLTNYFYFLSPEQLFRIFFTFQVKSSKQTDFNPFNNSNDKVPEVEFNIMLLNWIMNESDAKIGLEKFLNHLLSNTLQINIITFILNQFYQFLINSTFSKSSELGLTQTSSIDSLLNSTMTKRQDLSDMIGQLLSVIDGSLLYKLLFSSLPLNQNDTETLLHQLSLSLKNSKAQSLLDLNKLNILLSHLINNGNNCGLNFSYNLNDELIEILFKTISPKVINKLVSEYFTVQFIQIQTNLSVQDTINSTNNIYYSIFQVLLLQVNNNPLQLLDFISNNKKLSKNKKYFIILYFTYLFYDHIFTNTVEKRIITTKSHEEHTIIKEIFNTYIITYLSINSTDDSKRANEENDLEIFNNIIILKCIYLYNIIINSYSASSHQPITDDGKRQQQNLLNIYYNIITNIVNENEKLTIFYIYKLQILLIAIVNLLFSISNTSHSSDSDSSGSPDDEDAGIEEILSNVLGLILKVLNNEMSGNNVVIVNIIDKLLYKILTLLNYYIHTNPSKSYNQLEEFYGGYIVYILEIIFFYNLNNLQHIPALNANLWTQDNKLILNNNIITLLYNIIIKLYSRYDTKNVLINSIKHVINSLAYFINTGDDLNNILYKFKLLFIHLISNSEQNSTTDDVLDQVVTYILHILVVIVDSESKVNLVEILYLIQFLINNNGIKSHEINILLNHYKQLHGQDVLLNSIIHQLTPNEETAQSDLESILKKYRTSGVDNSHVEPSCKFLLSHNKVNRVSSKGKKGRKRRARVVDTESEEEEEFDEEYEDESTEESIEFYDSSEEVTQESIEED